MATNIVIIAAAYLLGAIPTGLVLTRLFSKVDIRRQGSGNIGATNVGRLAGPRLGLLTLFFDVLKGALPVLAALQLDRAGREWVVAAVCLAAVLGHLYPVYMKFKGGGKGVATAAGCFLVAVPAALFFATGVFAAVVVVSRRVSAGSLAAAVALAIGAWLFSSTPWLFLSALCVSLLVVARHKDNIKRLVSGSEPTFFGGTKK